MLPLVHDEAFEEPGRRLLFQDAAPEVPQERMVRPGRGDRGLERRLDVEGTGHPPEVERDRCEDAAVDARFVHPSSIRVLPALDGPAEPRRDRHRVALASRDPGRLETGRHALREGGEVGSSSSRRPALRVVGERVILVGVEGLLVAGLAPEREPGPRHGRASPSVASANSVNLVVRASNVVPTTRPISTASAPASTSPLTTVGNPRTAAEAASGSGRRGSRSDPRRALMFERVRHHAFQARVDEGVPARRRGGSSRRPRRSGSRWCPRARPPRRSARARSRATAPRRPPLRWERPRPGPRRGSRRCRSGSRTGTRPGSPPCSMIVASRGKVFVTVAEAIRPSASRSRSWNGGRSRRNAATASPSSVGAVLSSSLGIAASSLDVVRRRKRGGLPEDRRRDAQSGAGHLLEIGAAMRVSLSKQTVGAW